MLYGAWFAISAHYMIRDPLMEVVQGIIDVTADWLGFAWMAFVYTISIISTQIIIYGLVK